MSETPVKVAVTGAAGQICYSLLFRIASGSLLGDRPIELRLLEITPALKALEGVVMELEDCAFPNLVNVVIGDDPRKVFEGANLAMLVGAMPRKAGMERGDLLSANGAIFTAQGQALNESAAEDIRVLVTGNPANTNALIAMSNAPDIPRERFNALTRLDHNRAKAMLAQEARRQRRRDHQHDHLGQPLLNPVPRPPSTPRSAVRTPGCWSTRSDRDHLHPAGGQAWRGDHRRSWRQLGRLAANATVEHMRDCAGTPEGDWVSMAVPSDGSYGVPEGLISSFPCVVRDGRYQIVQDLELDGFSQDRINRSVAELADEKQAVTELGLI